MTETPAEIVSEHVPEIKWPERIIIWSPGPGYAWNISATDVDGVAEIVRSRDMLYRILRVHPPVTRRVEIDYEAVKRNWIGRFGYGCTVTSREIEFIERHARIVEEAKP